MLVDKADAKRHLRLIVADGEPLDLELDQKLASAESAVLDYVSRNQPGMLSGAGVDQSGGDAGERAGGRPARPGRPVALPGG